MTIQTATISALYRYPVKSCRGHAVAGTRYDAHGLLNDRRWMIVSPEGDFITQRELPRLARVAPRLAPEGSLRLNAEGFEPVLVPAPQAPARWHVRVWNDRVPAADAGDAPAAWLERVLGHAARLVRIGQGHQRPLKQDPGAPPGVSAAFADAYPFLLISEASLAELNTRLPQPLPMNRFRPNIVVSGCAAFAEDRWRELRVGGQRFAVAAPCARCAITTTDQERGVRDGKEPLRTLATFRRIGPDTGVYFGQNVVQLQPSGWLRVGDSVEVIA